MDERHMQQKTSYTHLAEALQHFEVSFVVSVAEVETQHGHARIQQLSKVFLCI